MAHAPLQHLRNLKTFLLLKNMEAWKATIVTTGNILKTTMIIPLHVLVPGASLTRSSGPVWLPAMLEKTVNSKEHC